jgi:hypothetical protein
VPSREIEKPTPRRIILAEEDLNLAFVDRRACAGRQARQAQVKALHSSIGVHLTGPQSCFVDPTIAISCIGALRFIKCWAGIGTIKWNGAVCSAARLARGTRGG